MRSDKTKPLTHPSPPLSVREQESGFCSPPDKGELEGVCSGTPANILFVLCGDGAARQRLMARYPDLPNVMWLPLQRLNDLLNMADIHLLPQRADVADLVMPSKLTGMLASGRAVLATALPETQVAKVVQQCGMVYEPGDADALKAAILQLTADSELRQKLGTAAREYALAHLGKVAVLTAFESQLQGSG
ncbi:MAG TPA: glycosyltransferase [Gallionella sp.]|nr:glycosyltransferase [Gallionella sp.]